MPYIKIERREEIAPFLEDVLKFLADPVSVGDLNYIITTILKRYVGTGIENYAKYNAAIGVLEAAKLEFYRRAVSAYENTKIKENGDVY